MLLFSTAINTALYIRAALAIAKRLLSFLAPILFNTTVLLCGLFALTNQWRIRNISFPDEAYYFLIPGYFVIWSLNYLILGAFDEPVKLIKQFKAIITGTIIILVFYALLPKELQFSRLYIIMGALWYFSWLILNKALLNLFSGKGLRLNRSTKRKFLVVGDEN
jgi:hypothetical protein